MASERLIKTQIEQLVGEAPGNWTIGVTEDPLSSKAKHGNPLNWCHWKADSNEIAVEVKNYFLERGMQNGGGKESRKALYVYVF